MSIVILLGAFAVLVAIGLPISFAMGLSSVLVLGLQSTIPLNLIAPFLNEAVVFSADELEGAPRVVAAPESRVVMGRGDRAYVRGELGGVSDWRLFRQATPLVDPATKEVLGYEARFVGTAAYVREAGTAPSADGKGSVPVPATFEITTRTLIAWNLAIAAYLVLVALMMRRSTRETMRQRARSLDEGRHTVLVLAVVAALAGLLTVVLELHNLKDAPTGVIALHIGLSIATILTAWSFVHVIFAEHYAHAFYNLGDDFDSDGDDSTEDQKRKGLHFPGQPWPDYLDFLYFSFTIGVANQTADTEVVSRGMRMLVLIHSIISYFFNTIILALTINIAAGMLGSS